MILRKAINNTTVSQNTEYLPNTSQKRGLEPMKAETIEQYHVLEFIKNNFMMEAVTLELIDRYSIRLTDSKGEQMIFKYENGAVTWE